MEKAKVQKYITMLHYCCRWRENGGHGRTKQGEGHRRRDGLKQLLTYATIGIDKLSRSYRWGIKESKQDRDCVCIISNESVGIIILLPVIILRILLLTWSDHYTNGEHEMIILIIIIIITITIITITDKLLQIKIARWGCDGDQFGWLLSV